MQSLTLVAPVDAVVLLTGHGQHDGTGCVALPAGDHEPRKHVVQLGPNPLPAGHTHAPLIYENPGLHWLHEFGSAHWAQLAGHVGVHALFFQV